MITKKEITSRPKYRNNSPINLHLRKKVGSGAEGDVSEISKILILIPASLKCVFFSQRESASILEF